MMFSLRGYFQVYPGKNEIQGPGIAHGPTGHPEQLYNFLDSVRSREHAVANATVAHLSCGLVHLGDIAYRAGRMLHFNPTSNKLVNDREADKLLTKECREAWAMPDPV